MQRFPNIRAAIDEAKESVLAGIGITRERLLREYSRIAFLDIRKAFTAGGHLLPIGELDDDTAAAIGGMDVEELWEGRGADRERVGTLRKLKLIDKNKALDSIAKYLGMFVEKHEHSGPDGGPIKTETSLDDAARRIAFLLSGATPKQGEP